MPRSRRRRVALFRAPWIAVSALALAAAVAGAVLVVHAFADGSHRASTGDVRSSVLLQTSDLGSGWRLAGMGSTASPPQWPWAQEGFCPGYIAADYPAQQHRVAARDQTFTDPAGDDVRQVIELFQPGWAERSVSDVRRVLSTCGSYRVPGGAVTFQIVAANLAGPETLLVYATIRKGSGLSSTTYFVVAEDDSLVSTVESPGPLGEGFARQLAAKTMARLGGDR